MCLILTILNPSSINSMYIMMYLVLRRKCLKACSLQGLHIFRTYS